MIETNIASIISAANMTFEELLASAPSEPIEEWTNPNQKTPSKAIPASTGFPDRYRDEWPIPTDEKWSERFARAINQLKSNGTLALIGPRGTGKTRLAAELMRSGAMSRNDRYTTAMGLFLRIRKSFSKDEKTTESDIVDEMAECPLLVIDEMQERGNTAWEDRLITHIIDRRYGDMLPTIIIANLTKDALASCLGESVVSRMNETGGVMEITGQTFRTRKTNQ